MSPSADTVADRFRVVLVEPQESRNVGSVARAMRNLGFRHLHLVAPRGYDRDRAAATACWAVDLLDEIVIHEEFADAISDQEEVVGLSGRLGKTPPHHTTLPEWSRTVPAGGPPSRTALVFGPEDSGLRSEHLEQCRRVIRIPASVDCPSFNLSQAVLLVLYEIVRSAESSPEPTIVGSAAAELPTWNDYFQLDRLLDAVMTGSGFLRQGTPAPVPGAVRNLFRRLPLDRQEMGILLGLFGKLNTTLRRGAAPGSRDRGDVSPQG